MTLASPFARLQLSKPLPNSRTNALWALGLFISVQVADGVMTAVGIARFGPAIEGNPLLVHTIQTFGPSGTLIAAKLVAIVGGTVLHAYSYHLALALLTVGYVFGTLLPWAMLLG